MNLVGVKDRAVFNFENYVSPQIGKIPPTIPETDLRVNPIDEIAFSQTSKPFEVQEVINKYKGTDIARTSKYSKIFCRELYY